MARSAPQITDRIIQERDRFEALSPDQKTVALRELAGGGQVADAGEGPANWPLPIVFPAIVLGGTLAIWGVAAHGVGLL